MNLHELLFQKLFAKGNLALILIQIALNNFHILYIFFLYCLLYIFDSFRELPNEQNKGITELANYFWNKKVEYLKGMKISFRVHI